MTAKTHPTDPCHSDTEACTDTDMWERIRIIPFPVEISDAEAAELKVALRAELPGILRWAVEGCLEWQRIGLAEPATVQSASQGYHPVPGVVGRFLEECCDMAPKARVNASDLYRSYVRWCEEGGESAMSTREFGQEISRRGFAKVKSNSKIWRLGLALSAAD